MHLHPRRPRQPAALNLGYTSLTLLVALAAIPALGDTVERWDFDSGTFWPHWSLLNHGLYSDHAFGAIISPDFAVVDLLCLNGTCSDGSTSTERGSTGSICDCLKYYEPEERDHCKGTNPSWAKPSMYADCRPHNWPASKYFLSSAVPWNVRDQYHEPLLVRSNPFILGRGDLSFWLFGGCTSDCTDAAGYHLHKGRDPIGNTTGVALRTTSDDARVAVATADNEHEWQQDVWTAEELRPFVGKEVTIDLHDTLHGAWGWFSVDDFQVPIERAKSRDEQTQLQEQKQRAGIAEQRAGIAEQRAGMWKHKFHIAVAFAVVGWVLTLIATLVVSLNYVNEVWCGVIPDAELEMSYNLLSERGPSDDFPTSQLDHTSHLQT